MNNQINNDITLENVSEEEVQKLSDEQLNKLSGGSLEKTKDGKFHVFNEVTKEDFGIYDDWNEAVKVARKNKSSGMGTWGDTEIPFGLIGTGKNRKSIRLEEDETGKPNKTYGSYGTAFGD